jgi:2-C-methyl-D-erythritol 2,4-cyclodiphosphate synthase/2-C-methyl-D-erythritol 4-phosphate cytidylyltransferase
MGAGNKAFLPLAGRPALFWTLDRLSAVEELAEVVVVVAPEEVERARERLAPGGFGKVTAVVPGGAERQDSVAAGLLALSPEVDTVVVHDGARPLVEPETVRAALALLAEKGPRAGVGVGVPVKDTIKVVGEGGRILETPPRHRLWAIHTPQVFPAELLRQAYAEARGAGITAATDDCALVERLGVPVWLMRDSFANLKLTTPEDLVFAEGFLAGQGRSKGRLCGAQNGGRTGMRVGLGYDVHRLVEGRPLILGGVRVPHERGLLGHSDADVLTHAVMDALLGAAALGDLGQHFPDTDPAYAGADSLELLRQVARKVADQGFRVLNVDAVVIAEQPRLARHLSAMRERLAEALGCPREEVGVKATTTEGLGFAGREEGLAAQAVCLIVREGQ